MTGIIEGMVFTPPFKPFALVLSPPYYYEGNTRVQHHKPGQAPGQDIELKQAEVKTTLELSKLVHLDELRKTQGGETEAGQKEWNAIFEEMSKVGGFHSFPISWMDQLLMHVMKQIGLVVPAEEKTREPMKEEQPSAVVEPIVVEGTEEPLELLDQFATGGCVSPQGPEPDYTEIKDHGIRAQVCDFMSEMLDNPDGDGIYPTSRFMWKMERYILAEIRAAKREVYDTTLGAYMEDQLRKHAAYGGVDLVAGERLRQIVEEGMDSDDDAEHKDGSLAMAAAAYAQPLGHEVQPADLWPDSWDLSWFKRGKRVHDLKIAGALICAELDRLLRLQRTETMEKEENANAK